MELPDKWGFLIVEIRPDVKDTNSLVGRVSKIEGVGDVKFNHLSRKLSIEHDRRRETLDEIDAVVGRSMVLAKRRSRLGSGREG